MLLNTRESIARFYSVDDVLAHVDIPLPEDDDLSDDDFDGYMEEEEGDDDNSDDEGDEGDGEEDDEESGSENNGIPDFVAQAWCSQEMANKTPLEFFQLFVTDEMLEGFACSRPSCLQSSLSTAMSCFVVRTYVSGIAPITA